MRLEKSWRPIVTVEVDKHHSYEFCMGCDGQNPNHIDIFRLCVPVSPLISRCLSANSFTTF